MVHSVRVVVIKVSIATNVDSCSLLAILIVLNMHVHISQLFKMVLHNEYSIINVFHQLGKREGII